MAVQAVESHGHTVSRCGAGPGGERTAQDIDCAGDALLWTLTARSNCTLAITSRSSKPKSIPLVVQARCVSMARAFFFGIAGLNILPRTLLPNSRFMLAVGFLNKPRR